jgi:CRP/FNR family transcriptional regulator
MVPESLSKELHELLLTGRRSKRSKGQIIQSTEGQRTINLVSSGFIKRYLISNTGNLGVEVIYGEGDIFPLTLMFKTLFDQDIYEGPEVYYYEAMSETQIYSIDISTLAENVEKNPLLYRDLLSESGKRLHSTLNGLENLALRTSHKRVAHQLVYFANQFGEKRASGIKINIPLTHQDLADILSLTRETVSTCIAKLREEKLIKTGKNIIVPNIEKLKEEAHS